MGPPGLFVNVRSETCDKINVHLLSVNPMAPRPRTIGDDEILMATARTISRVGPARFTLAEVATDAGISAATLVQRFGSKRGLLLAFARSGVEGIDACFDAVRAAHASPLDALVAAATEMTRHVRSPDEMANHLAFLQIDISDPDFYALMLENSTRILAGYRTLLAEAIEARELARCDTARLARAVGALAGGSLIAWAVHRKGTAEAYVRHDLETLLAPYRRRRRPDRRRRGPAPRARSHQRAR
jgi:AcrR family transcriptional regulator